MKKILLTILISSLITSTASASEVIDVFEEYAQASDFVCKTNSVVVDTSKNESSTINFITECKTPYTLQLTSLPKNGTISLNENNEFVYTPFNNFSGADSFQYRISSNGVQSNISECSITVCENIPETRFCYEDMKNHSSRYAAEKMAEKNIIKGEKIAGKYYFHPDMQITRGVFVSYLSAAMGLSDENSSYRSVFADENSLSNQLKQDAYTCWSSGIVTGKNFGDENYFCADAPLTRAEMFTMTDRAYSGKTNSNITLEFPDEKLIPDYAKISVKNLVSNGFITNSRTDELRPCDTATKAEMAELLYKLILKTEESTTKTLSQRIKEGFYANLIT